MRALNQSDEPSEGKSVENIEEKHDDHHCLNSSGQYEDSHNFEPDISISTNRKLREFQYLVQDSEYHIEQIEKGNTKVYSCACCVRRATNYCEYCKAYRCEVIIFIIKVIQSERL